MSWFSRMFAKGDRSRAAAEMAAPAALKHAAPHAPPSSEPAFSRATPNPNPVAQGGERATYLTRVAVVFGEAPDPNRSFQDYGLDELDVSESIQIAEEVWTVQLMPNPMRTEDYADMTRRFSNLNAIMTEAEAARAARS